MFDYTALATQYDLSRQQVQLYCMAAMSESLSEAFHADVICRPDGEILLRAGEIERRRIKQTDLTSQIKRLVLHRIETTLSAASERRKFETAVRKENSVVFGECKYTDTGVSVYVEGDGGQNLYVGFAKYSALPVRERRKWSLIGRRAWYVNRASRTEKGLLILNRDSIQLPGLLIEKLAWLEGVFVQAHVVSRDPGKACKVMLSNPVPGSVLAAVRKELGEAVYDAVKVKKAA